MQLQKIGVYTNPYSTNKNQQHKTKNPIGFGMEIVGNKKAIEEVVGIGNADKVLAAIGGWSKNMVARILKVVEDTKDFRELVGDLDPTTLNHWDEIYVESALNKETGHITAYVGEGRPLLNCGMGMSSKSDQSGKLDLVEATIEALDKGLNDYAKTKIFNERIWN